MFRGTRLDFVLRISIHALVLCGLMIVILTGEIPLPIWTLALVVHPLSILMRPKEGGALFNLVVILAFAYSIFLYTFLNTPLLIALTQLLIVIQALKLFHIERAKDYFQLAGLSLLMMLVATELTSHLYYLFFFLAFLLIGIWFLILLHVKGDLERHPHMSPPPRHLTSLSLFLGISGTAFCSFCLTFFLFFALPRLSLSVTGKERWGGTSAGFSDVVDLSDSGPVQLDERVVMRVELPHYDQPPPVPLYWRGTTLSRWNGQAWQKENMVRKIEKRERYERVSLRRVSDRSKAIYQLIMIEPLGTDLLFCLHPPFEIEGDFSCLNIDEGGGLHLPSPPLRRYHYEVYSSLQPYMERHHVLQGGGSNVYLQLPEGSEYIVALAQDIVKGERSILGKVKRVISYLQNNCTYSLNPKWDDIHPPLEDFLLHNREGYCEHFASAAALLLRGAGVPTRLVCGFLQGEWNPIGRYFMVRQRDAHVWIEAYLPGSGWLPFDPTPASEERTSRFLLTTFYRYLDFLKLKWNRYIIHYTHDDQLRVLLAFRRGIRDLRLFPHPRSWQKVKVGEKSSQRPYFVLAGVVFLAAILLGFWSFKKMKRTTSIRSANKLPREVSFYLKILRALSRRKIVKQENETPAEFARRIGQARGDLYPALEKITHLYYRVRFGHIPLTAQEREEMIKIAKELKQRTSPLRHGEELMT